MTLPPGAGVSVADGGDRHDRSAPGRPGGISGGVRHAVGVRATDPSRRYRWQTVGGSATAPRRLAAVTVLRRCDRTMGSVPESGGSAGSCRRRRGDICRRGMVHRELLALPARALHRHRDRLACPRRVRLGGGTARTQPDQRVRGCRLSWCVRRWHAVRVRLVRGVRYAGRRVAADESQRSGTSAARKAGRHLAIVIRTNLK